MPNENVEIYHPGLDVSATVKSSAVASWVQRGWEVAEESPEPTPVPEPEPESEDEFSEDEDELED